MKAKEFVKKYGWLGAKEYLAGATFLDDNLLVFTNAEELQNLVNAYELVGKFGGVNGAKKVLKKAYDSCSSIISNRKQGFECVWFELKGAIELVENVNE